jgi:hypothetical protein
MARWPPRSHASNLKLPAVKLFTLKPCVGMIYCRSSFESDFRIVVLPALSRPRTHIRTDLRDNFFFAEEVNREEIRELKDSIEK